MWLLNEPSTHLSWAWMALGAKMELQPRTLLIVAGSTVVGGSCPEMILLVLELGLKRGIEVMWVGCGDSAFPSLGNWTRSLHVRS